MASSKEPGREMQTFPTFTMDPSSLGGLGDSMGGFIMESANNYVSRSYLGAVPLYALPVVAVVGIFVHSSVLAIIIRRRLFRSSSLFVFLGFISFLDVIFLGFHAVIDAVEVHLNKSVAASAFTQTKGSDVFCKIKAYGTYASGSAVTWVSIAAIVYRMYGLWRPMDLLRREHPLAATNICVLVTLIPFGAFVAAFWYVVILAAPVIMPSTIILDCNMSGMALAWLDLGMYSLLPGIVIMCVAIGLTAMFFRSRYMLRDDAETDKLSPALQSARDSLILLLTIAILLAVCCLTDGVRVLHDRIFVEYKILTNKFDVLLAYMLGRLYDLCHILYPFIALAISPFFRRKLFYRKQTGTGNIHKNMLQRESINGNDTAMHY